MSAPLRILLLDDSASDVELVQRELRRAGLAFEARVANDRKSYLHAIQTGAYDVILADFKLPDLLGPDVLRLARAHEEGVPVIFVTGVLGDEAAVETIKLGAADYVLKDRPARLAPAVRQAVREAASARERQRTQADLRKAHKQTAEALSLLETLQSSAPVGFGFVDHRLRVIFVNERLAAVPGAPQIQFRGRTVAGSIPDLWPHLEGVFRRVLETGEAVANLEVAGETAEEPGRSHSWLASFYPVRLKNRILGVGIVAVEITERKDAERERAELTRAAAGAIAAAVEARDRYTAGHQRRVGKIAALVAEELGFDRDATEGVALAADIHDIGKISIPSEILSRPGPLSELEFELLKGHPQAGHDIVAGIRFPWPVPDMILQHHENFDGSGYPQALSGDGILIGARIIRVADTLEAMASHRPYRAARGVEAALEQIARGTGSLFDPAVAEVTLSLHRNGRIDLQGWT